MGKRPKPRTGAQRQAAYRERMRENDMVARLDIVTGISAPGRLARLAAHMGVSPGDVLDKLLRDTENAILNRMKPDDETRYYAMERVTG
jgi:hypothetical protein